MNFVHIAGHLGADPEVRFTSTGKKVTVLRVATRTRKGQNDDTIWWRVTIWGDQYDKMIPYLKKGSAIVVAGEFHKPEMFTDREGKPQISSMEITASYIQFSPFGKPGSASGQQSQQENPSCQSASATAATPSTPGGALFGAFKDGTPTPYSMQNPASVGKGETFDDEVPF